jgi:transcriptional regulator with AAA-type ATPase domain
LWNAPWRWRNPIGSAWTICRRRFAEVLCPSLARRDSLRVWGSRYARLVLERCGGNTRDACRVLDISYHTLQAYLRHEDCQQRPRVARLPAWVRSTSDPRDEGPTE